MNRTTTLAAIKALRVGALSITVNNTFVVVKTGRNTWRLGELMGDWLMHGTADEVIARAYRGY